MANIPRDERPAEALDRLTWNDPKHRRANENAERADTTLDNIQAAEQGESVGGRHRPSARASEKEDHDDVHMQQEQQLQRQPNPDLDVDVGHRARPNP